MPVEYCLQLAREQYKQNDKPKPIGGRLRKTTTGNISGEAATGTIVKTESGDAARALRGPHLRRYPRFSDRAVAGMVRNPSTGVPSGPSTSTTLTGVSGEVATGTVPTSTSDDSSGPLKPGFRSPPLPGKLGFTPEDRRRHGLDVRAPPQTTRDVTLNWMYETRARELARGSRPQESQTQESQQQESQGQVSRMQDSQGQPSQGQQSRGDEQESRERETADRLAEDMPSRSRKDPSPPR